MDLDPFLPVGIEAPTMRLLDVFLLHCLLADSPPDTPQEIAALARNQHRVAARGREPGLRLERGGKEASLSEWGAEVLGECAPIAAGLDAAHGGSRYGDALAAANAVLGNPDAAPSARVLLAMAAEHENSYVAFARAQSVKTRQSLLKLPFPAGLEARFRQQAEESIAEQKKIEAADTMPFEIYREKYLSKERLGI
jgi:glutamate--cysteine ligase